jgi:GAF domain-containing protein
LAIPIKLKGEIIGVLDVQSVELDALDEDDIFILQTLADQLAIAIENARLYAQAQARSRYLETLQQVNATLRSTLPLSQVLETVTQSAGKALNYIGSLITMPDATGERLTLGAVWGSRFLGAAVKHTGLEAASFSLPLTAEKNPIVRACLSGELQAWNGEPERIVVGIEPAISPKLAPVIRRAMGAKGVACVPLPVGKKVVGVLVVFSPREQFSDEERAMLLGLADQAGLAIENARLYQETVRRLKETETLGAVTTALTRSLDPDQVLQSIVDSATRLIPASTSGVIHFADEAAGKLIPQATSAPEANVWKAEMPIGEGIAGLAMQEKRLINVPNVEEDPRFLPLDTGTLKKSLLAAPLLIDGDCIGILSLNSDRVGAFSADDERLLTTLAAQAAIAVRNARLHQEVQRRVEELIFLNRVGRAVTSSLDLEQILATVMEETVLMLGTEAGSLLLLDEESNELVFEAAVGPRSEKAKSLRVPLGRGIAGWVVREGQRLLVPDVGKDPRFYPDIDGGTGFVTRSLLAVPLKVKGKVIGVIEAVNKTEGYFSQEDVALLSAMAQPAAIAIENAQLYKDLQDRMEELKRTQAQLIQSARLAAIGELAAGVAHEINNPLTGIMGFTRLLLQEVDDDAPIKEDLRIIDREAARTKDIVRGLLDFASQRETRLEPADVNEIVRSTVTLVRHQAKGARVTIKESYDENLPLVSLDAEQIKQVFLNIITNAIQAMPKGGELKVVTAYWPQARSPELVEARSPALAKGIDGADCVVVEFHDSGTGISVENLPRIFDPFFTTKEVAQGTGLGLSISHGIVERHGGRIEVKSEVGQGSTFTVMLPVAEGQREG